MLSENQFSGLNILIIGDLMLDQYFYGNANRISPEAPVPIVEVSNKIFRLGGAGNVALNLKSLGANPYIFSVYGKDPKTEILLNLLEEADISASYIIEDNTRVGTCKTRIIADNQHLIRIDDEQVNEISPSKTEQLIDKVIRFIDSMNVQGVIFQDYDKGVISPQLIEAVTEYSSRHSVPTFVDPKMRNFLNYKNNTVFKPNFKELCQGLGLQHIRKNDLQKINNILDGFRSGQKHENIVLTLSEYGICFVDNDGHFECYQPSAKKIIDVSGAGDTVISVLACAVASGLGIAESTKLGNMAGGLVCEEVGVVPVDVKKLIRTYNKKSALS